MPLQIAKLLRVIETCSPTFSMVAAITSNDNSGCRSIYSRRKQKLNRTWSFSSAKEQVDLQKNGLASEQLSPRSAPGSSHMKVLPWPVKHSHDKNKSANCQH